MTTTVLFVRHGAHDRLGLLCGRMPGVSLNRTGRQQAARVAARLSGERIECVYASPLERARETASPIAAALGLTVSAAEDLNEVDVGSWTGIAFADLQNDPRWQRWNEARSHHRAPGGESMLQVQLRVSAWLGAIVERHPESTVVAVCHADVIKSALAYALSLSLDNLHRIETGLGSVSTIVAGDWGARVHSMNETPIPDGDA